MPWIANHEFWMQIVKQNFYRLNSLWNLGSTSLWNHIKRSWAEGIGSTSKSLVGNWQKQARLSQTVFKSGYNDNCGRLTARSMNIFIWIGWQCECVDEVLYSIWVASKELIKHTLLSRVICTRQKQNYYIVWLVVPKILGKLLHEGQALVNW